MLTPNLVKFARDGTWYTNARTAVPLTLPAHVTLMTGALPLAILEQKIDRWIASKKAS